MNKDLNRQLNGTAFLSLEHWSYMVLVVLVPVLLLIGFDAALAIWTNRPNEMLAMSMFGGASQMSVDVSMAVSVAAALLVLAPLMFVLRRRTNAEMAKRPGYVQRTAYKLPIYGAMIVLAIIKTVAFITMVAVVLHSLTLIGVKGADIGSLYSGQFMPALLALVVSGATSWYVIMLAKGRDRGNQFSFVAVWVAALMVVTLFTTAIMATHNPKNQQDTDRSPFQTPQGINYDSWLE